MEEMKRCDLLLIMGTSLSTQPVSNYVKLFEDKDIVRWEEGLRVDCNESDKCAYSK